VSDRLGEYEVGWPLPDFCSVVSRSAIKRVAHFAHRPLAPVPAAHRASPSSSPKQQPTAGPTVEGTHDGAASLTDIARSHSGAEFMDEYRDGQPEDPEARDAADVWAVPGIRLEQAQDLVLSAE
jgi:hypothetical protein